MRSIAILICVVAIFGGTAYAADYIGEAKCKMCHKVQHASWSEMAHAKAFDKLKPEEQGKAECLKCHATGESAEMPGVQCEACHGPGSEYKSMKVWKDQDAAKGAGLVLPDEALCKSCHENAPHEVPEFDYATAKEKGIHAHKE
jgi:DnaJ-class molecular chaperone